MSDNSNFSETQRQQLAAEAVALSGGTPDQQAQAQNIAAILNADAQNQANSPQR